MHTYKLEEARKLVMNCAKQYASNLLGKKYLIIYQNKADNIIQYMEIQFEANNYQHLTGIELIDKSGVPLKNVASLFYKKCLSNTLKKNEIQFKSDGTTPLKLLALPSIMNIQKITKVAGDYNYSHTYLTADKLIGNINFCLGLKEINNKTFVPISALLENIKKLTSTQSQVLAIFSKNSTDTRYHTIRHVAKGTNLNSLTFPDEISHHITLCNYTPKA